MTVTTLDPGTVFGGIDPHLDTIHVPVVAPWGRDIAGQASPPRRTATGRHWTF